MLARLRARTLVVVTLLAVAGCEGADTGAQTRNALGGLTFDVDDCPPGSNVIMGTSGDDVLVGTSGDDCIVGLDGNDVLRGKEGDDMLIGRGGNDELEGNNGRDILDGGDGDDELRGGNGRDTLLGGTGNDPINGGNGDDEVDGGAGNDIIATGNGDDNILGGVGNDIIAAGRGDDVVQGDDGNDVIDAGKGADEIAGGAGTDACDGAGCESPAPSSAMDCSVDADCGAGGTCLTTVDICVYCSSDCDCGAGANCQSIHCEPLTGCVADPAPAGPCPNVDPCNGSAVCVDGPGWASLRDLTDAEFSDKFEEYADDGYMMVDVDAYPEGFGMLYSMVWQENVDGRGWVVWRDVDNDTYHEKWEELKDQGYRPTDVEGYDYFSFTFYAGIWVENVEGFDWVSHRNLTSTEFGDYFDEHSADGFRLVDMAAYDTPSGLRYAAIWYENVDNIAWVEHRDMDRDEYQEKIDDLDAQGYRVIDYETYSIGAGTRLYAAIWEENVGNLAYHIRSDRSEIEYANYWRLYADEGLRIIDFERYGSDYAGVWVENEPRYRWAKKDEIDSIVEGYRASNGIPGISVALIHDGTTIYRRGFGMADVAAGKDAHGQTVYLAGSVSKVIGGTLAAKMEAEGHLSDGTPVSLDMTDPTSHYLSGLPAAHSHTVEELFSHHACIWHYDTGPEPPEDYYSHALDAAEEIWDTPPLANCTIGTDRNYSTHGLTFAGACLEEAAGGRSIARLVEEEIGEQYDLDSLQVQYRYSDLRSNYERAAPYSDSGSETSYDDNSWKVLGGGIEVSAVDLARFGWKTLNGEIVDPTVRDDRLWSPIAPDRVNGIAWEVGYTCGRQIAEHGGAWSGARAHLRVYRNASDQLVIAIMSNRDGHEPSGLATDLANAVLNP